MAEIRVGVLGATSLVGGYLLSRLAKMGCGAVAFSRKEQIEAQGGTADWRQISGHVTPDTGMTCSIHHWICAAPIWALPEHFPMLEDCGVRKVVVLSSTSRFTKDQSAAPEERDIAKRVAGAESQVRSWAERRGVEWIILRPTLIYGLGRDKNISEIVRFIRRFGFFPLLGEAQGLRQPVHAEDVAAACVSALQTFTAANHAYNISGGETLAYRDMVARVFAALGRPPRLLNVPLWAFRLAAAVLSCLPHYRSWSYAMAERMNHDLVFDYADAVRAFGFKPRAFVLAERDLP